MNGDEEEQIGLENADQIGHSSEYADKVILAPMVRQNNLPFRLLCLRYGADLVYSEEIIDHKLMKCRRLKNKALGTVDFVDELGKIVLRTCEEEHDKLIIQIGSSDPDRAVAAFKLVIDDVAGLDFNFGCPKSFSLSGGMGAALLSKPEMIRTLLTTAVSSFDKPVTCKIRLLPNLEETLQLVKLIESCQVSAIAVHGRTKIQRPKDANQNDVIRQIVDTVQIPVIANGDSNHIKSYDDIVKFRAETRAASVMVARAVMKDPSLFKCDNKTVPIDEILCEYLKLAVRYDNYIAMTKYTMQSMLGHGKFKGDILKRFHSAKDHETLCAIFNLDDWYKLNSPKLSYHDFEPSSQQIVKRPKSAN